MAAPLTPLSMDVDMLDAPTATASPSSSGLSSPPDSGPDDDDEWVDLDSTDQQINSPDQISLSSPGAADDMSNMATRRSTRNINKPRATLVDSPPRPPKRKIVAKMSSAKKTPKWTAETLLTDSKSPLASADLRTILCQPAAWDILSKDGRAEILALFPAGTPIVDAGTDDARPDFEALRNDNNFRHDCATYSDNIAQGRHDPEWLEQAWAARDRRRMGDFDAYLAQKFEDEWSCELPESFRPDRGQGSADVTSAPAAAADADEEMGLEQDAKGSVETEDASGSPGPTAPASDAPATEAASSREVESDFIVKPTGSGGHDVKLVSPILDVKEAALGGEVKVDEEKRKLANDHQEKHEQPEQPGKDNKDEVMSKQE